MGVTSTGSLAANVGDEKDTLKMRISQMDAEDPAFRNELQRRKEHYEMGATYRLGRGGRRKSVAENDTKSSGKKRRGSVGKKKSIVVEKIEAVKGLRVDGVDGVDGVEVKTLGAPATPGVFKNPPTPGMTPGTNTGSPGFEFGRYSKKGVLDVSVVPMMNATRPTMPSPKGSGGGFGGPSMVTSKSLPSPLLTQANTGKDGKQLVTFSRPKKSNGLFVDPTFIEVAPVSGLEKLGNKKGKPQMLSEKSLTEGKPYEEIETYTHIVDILGSKVKISGQRVAGPQPVLDDAGRPLSAVTFENVHEASVRRELVKLKMNAGGLVEER
jgi:hypothetical protein